ncbi:hypothetical protein BS17DRAFT_817256 [Gyrodon lividus]|nr:hypothetical protein BS17DRAFT_817256 [Gyrodon lividus]
MDSKIEDYIRMFNDPRFGTCRENDTHTEHDTKTDTRRFGGIFLLEVSEDISVDCGDATNEEYGDSCTDVISQWAFCADHKTTTQTPSAPSTDEGSTISAAQQIIARYRETHGNDHEPDYGSPEGNEKDLPRIPDDQRSMYTLATSGHAQSTMDMMWRPKPKVHMRHRYQRELVEAQAQAIEMMRNAGLKPTDKIQCRRCGCADILRDLDALKYHLHIHNIADALDVPPVVHPHEAFATALADIKDAPTVTTRKTRLVDSAPSNLKALKSTHSRSQSSAVAQRKNPESSAATLRKLSAGGFLPPLFSPREITPETQYTPSLTAVAASVISTPSRSRSPAPIPDATKDTSLVHTPTQIPTPLRGRRMRKETIIAAVGAGYNASIAMMLSPPSSPTMGARAVLAPQTNLPLALPLPFPIQDGNEKGTPTHANKDPFVPGELERSRSPGRERAMSPARAMSPIRSETPCSRTPSVMIF